MADAFFQHPRHKRASWDDTNSRFVIDNKPQFEGLLDPLKRNFYSNYDSKIAWENRTDKSVTKKRKRASSKGKDKGSKKKKFKKGSLKKRKPHYATYGQGRGRKLHKQIEMFVECETGVCKKTFKSRVKNIEDAVLAVIEQIKADKLEPWKSEVVIFDEKLGIATRIDLTCKHIPTGKLVTIELKFGFEGYANVSTGKMFSPLHKWPNHAANQWQLQKLMEVHMMIRYYGCKTETLMPWIWWVNFDTDAGKYVVTKHTLNAQTMESHAAVYKALETRRNK